MWINRISPAVSRSLIVTALGLALPLAPAIVAQTGSISGRVTGAGTTTGLANTTIRGYDEIGDVVATTTTDGLGDYQLTDLLSGGPYYVRTFASSSYLNEVYDDVLCTPSCAPSNGTPVYVTAGTTTTGIDFSLERSGSIAGTITDGATHGPLADAFVVVFDELGEIVASGSANDEGAYTVSPLAPGTYTVRSGNSEAYLNELYDDLPCSGCDICGSTCDATTGTPVEVVGGAITAGIDFALDPGGRIAGTVTEVGTGTPVDGGWIGLYDAQGTFFDLLSVNSGAYSSGAGLPSGPYTARTHVLSPHFNELYDDLPCRGACDVSQGTPVPSIAGAVTSGVDFALDPGGRISGSIVEVVSGTGIDDAWVEIYDNLGNRVSEAHANASGSYTSSLLEPGLYTVRTFNSAHYFDQLYDGLPCASGCDVTTGTPVLVVATLDTGGIDFEATPGGRISGAVFDAVTVVDPVIRARIEIFDSLGNRVASEDVDRSDGPDAGTYLSPPLEPGTYYVRTVNWGGFIDELYHDLPCIANCDVTAGKPVSVDVGAVTERIDFWLIPGGRIAGAVTDAWGVGLARVSVWVYDDLGKFVTGDQTGATGLYLSEQGLVTGNYHVVTVHSANYIDELYQDIPCPRAGGCDITTGTPVFSSVGSTTGGIDFALLPAGAILVDGFESGETSAWSSTVGEVP